MEQIEKDLLKVIIDIKTHCASKNACELPCEYRANGENCRLKDTLANLSYYISPKSWNIEVVKKGLLGKRKGK